MGGIEIELDGLGVGLASGLVIDGLGLRLEGREDGIEIELDGLALGG